MDSEIIADLKQFITAVITQQTNDIRQDIQKIDKKLVMIDEKIEKIDKKLMKLCNKYSAQQSNLPKFVLK